MVISELKQYIYDNKKIEYILQQLNCHNIKYNQKNNTFSASFPDGDNPQGINIRNNEHLNYRSFSRGVSYEEGKDIIDLVQYITNKNFVDSLKYLHNILGLKFTYKKQPEKTEKKYDPLNIFKRIKEKSRRVVVNVDDIHILDDNLLNDYVPMLHIDWLREGITERTREKFGLAYSYKHKRVVIPHRYWATGELVGFNMRTTVPNYEEFGIRKYYLTSGYNKSLNLYGYYENKEEIERKRYCVLVESEKSVLKRHSLGDGTCLALSGKGISTEQLRIIGGLRINELILCLDGDVDMNEVRWLAERFKNQIKISYFKDSWGILGEKDSPCDARNKDYQFLFDNRITYNFNTEEQNKLEKSLKK